LFLSSDDLKDFNTVLGQQLVELLAQLGSTSKVDDCLGTLVPDDFLLSDCCQRIDDSIGSLLQVLGVVEDDQSVNICYSVLSIGVTKEGNLLSHEICRDTLSNLCDDSRPISAKNLALCLDCKVVISVDWVDCGIVNFD
jgi:hypothetical protein